MGSDTKPVRPLKLIILDRDGVINMDSDAFIKTPAEWLPIKGSLEAIARLNQAGYRVVVATNQSGVARGLFDMVTLNAIHHKMHTAAQQVGADIDAVFFCPHSADDNCDCRKPKAGMFTDIARRYNLSLRGGVITVGDSLRDLQAGFVAGCAPYLVLTGKGKKSLDKGGLPPGTLVFPDLAAAVDFILKPSMEVAV
ncbi:D-glycero-beta-D-manno-heptose 1,7-bisphosphate 7-phosphatase [Herbaspirillum sp. RTI4]|uniref:D-glycero-beta-D-manno-heptose 1,7-bisphosphate 7-phosphatase n=1 Tax=Herbaspirillum sp. RTI4 TaxID=3048640 RepID=UPI002AB4E121|nr:D-glycero-beta-D-manno-heptose 1,7-bisphosphate 7-phosphatase [Herbaspirillum sp. RTI4]MDY7576755.1 D-glycero-beta-D-manno-heptose 1,7-bisphosphate 7-phosphatase [Herbaspirillum sp. RTI4]MEA9981351.1 D-glycero-beta-D-manno-heptose 1,7-bisphosphate 7-phosphatase [Herbaspirillum sp. RTI4]